MILNRFNNDDTFSEYHSTISKEKIQKEQIIERIVEGKYTPNLLYKMDTNKLKDVYLTGLNN